MLRADFFERPAPLLAPDLIGKALIRRQNGNLLVGIITETEAYQGQEDLACHARIGITKRNQVMYGEAGRAYIYFTYGMHWLLNIVADQVNNPAAVLIRAVFPLAGAETMALRRPHLAHSSQWLNGPAKLTQAFGIDGSLNGHDLRENGSGLYLTEALDVPKDKIQSSPRIGLGTTPEPWLSVPWRWELGWQDVKDLITEQKKEVFNAVF